MGTLLSLLVIAFASALVPIINLEAYLGVRASFAGDADVWTLGFVAALGQIIGKVVWYHLGASSLSWGWVRRRIEKPKQQALLLKWRSRTEARPVAAGGLVFVSALTGLPPFMILAVLAGQLRMNLTLFLVVGLLGRWLRFAAVLAGVGWMRELWLA